MCVYAIDVQQLNKVIFNVCMSILISRKKIANYGFQQRTKLFLIQAAVIFSCLKRSARIHTKFSFLLLCFSFAEIKTDICFYNNKQARERASKNFEWKQQNKKQYMNLQTCAMSPIVYAEGIFCVFFSLFFENHSLTSSLSRLLFIIC